MRCHICDIKLTEDEIFVEEGTGKYSPCTTCVGVAHTSEILKTIQELEEEEDD